MSSKRKRTKANEEDDNRELESIWQLPRTAPDWTPFLVISGTPNDALSALSIFAIGKALTALGIRKPKGVTRMKSGDLLIEVRNAAESTALKQCKCFAGLAVQVLPHRSLNTSKGVVKSFELKGATEKEIVDNIKDVIAARQIEILRDGKKVKTNTWILTFNSPKPPERIAVEYLMLSVRPFVPSPMRCYKCHRFGHTKLRCRGKALCPTCGQEGHTENCNADPWCRNCQKGGHKVTSKECPKWKQEKAILEHKARYGGTFAQARAEVFRGQPSADRGQTQSYREAAIKGFKIPDQQTPVSAPKTQNVTRTSDKSRKQISKPRVPKNTDYNFNLKLDIPLSNAFESLSQLSDTTTGSAESSALPTPSPLPSLTPPLPSATSSLPLSPLMSLTPTPSLTPPSGQQMPANPSQESLHTPLPSDGEEAMDDSAPPRHTSGPSGSDKKKQEKKPQETKKPKNPVKSEIHPVRNKEKQTTHKPKK